MLALRLGLTANPLAPTHLPGISLILILSPAESLEMKSLNKQNSVASLETVESKVNAALRRLVATNLVAVLFTDLAGNILSADESFLNMLGYDSGNLPPSIHELTPPEH